MEIRIKNEIPAPSAAVDSATPKLNRPNDSNCWKCAPDGVCKKCRIAAFHELTSGKTGGLRFCAPMQKIFPAIPQNGELSCAVSQDFSVTPLQLPVCWKLKIM